MNKIETIKSNIVTRYVIKSKKGNYWTENDGWTKNLKNAYPFASCWAASYMRENDFPSCKVVEVKLFTLQAIEEIGEVGESE